MVPNFSNGQVYAINKIHYEIGSPQRGDVVALYSPQNHQDRLIKRVIGLPGETVKIDNDHVYINGQLLTENYLPVGTITTPDQIVTLGPNQYFVLGDNRSVSIDSRSFGPVLRSLIIGKVTS